MANKDKKDPGSKPPQTELSAMARRTADGYENFLNRIGYSPSQSLGNTLSGGTYLFNVITQNRVLLEAMYRGSWICRMIVDCIAEDMTREGIIITTSDKSVDLKKFYAALRMLGIQEAICSTAKWGRLYGGAVGLLQIEGQDLSKPLNPDRISLGQFKGLIPFDRWMVWPVIQDPISSGSHMGDPAYYTITQDPAYMEPVLSTTTGENIVHHSRLLRYTGDELPYWQRIQTMMWGASVFEAINDKLVSYDNATLSAAQLIDKANLRTLKIERLREIVSTGGDQAEGIVAQMAFMRQYQASEGLTVLDKNDEFATDQYSFTGLADVLLQLAQQIAGGTKIPLVRLQGQSPAGLNSTGDSDWRNYYDNIRAQQESKLRDTWEIIIRVAWRSTFGVAPPDDLAFEFAPLWQATAKEKGEQAASISKTVLDAYAAEVIPRSIVLRELRDQSKQTGIFTNITDEDIDAADKEEELAPPPQADPADIPALHPELQANQPDPLAPEAFLETSPSYTNPQQDEKPTLWAKLFKRK